jgi:hypothetical protein
LITFLSSTIIFLSWPSFTISSTMFLFSGESAVAASQEAEQAAEQEERLQRQHQARYPNKYDLLTNPICSWLTNPICRDRVATVADFEASAGMEPASLSDQLDDLFHL